MEKINNTSIDNTTIKISNNEIRLVKIPEKKESPLDKLKSEVSDFKELSKKILINKSSNTSNDFIETWKSASKLFPKISFLKKKKETHILFQNYTKTFEY